MFKWLYNVISDWLTYEHPPRSVPLCDFERLSYEIRPCDVLLMEGRSRVSEVIKLCTQSPWSHSALYIGRLHDITDPKLREVVTEYYTGNPNTQLIIEGMLGKGTIISPLTDYDKDHIRICRPRTISRKDADAVISDAINHLGTDYDVRQLIDLFRLLYPWTIMPRRWRSSLFTNNPGTTTHVICSTIIAKAFGSVKYPILPAVRPHDKYGMTIVQRNPKLITPKDFDYSPYFEIIKYPFFNLDSHTPYRNLPWSDGELSNDDEDTFCPVNIMPTPEQVSIQDEAEIKIELEETKADKKTATQPTETFFNKIKSTNFFKKNDDKKLPIEQLEGEPPLKETNAPVLEPDTQSGIASPIEKSEDAQPTVSIEPPTQEPTTEKKSTKILDTDKILEKLGKKAKKDSKQSQDDAA